ncbi:M23 family metallopeptidase [Patescibacteria group bacterium]|nr:M23 family metallopeptidase [Patescibacteria group bacterium]
MKLLPFAVFGFLLVGCLNKQGKVGPSTSAQGTEIRPFLALPFPRGTKCYISEGWTYSAEEQAIHGHIKHRGIDFDAERNTPILAAADGWVIASYHQKPNPINYEGKPIGMALGRFVQIWHPEQGVYTQYGHLERIAEDIPCIKPTQTNDGWDPTFIYQPNGQEIPGWKEIKRGQVIGYMGDSGLYWGTPPQGPDSPMGPSWDEVHLHFEVYQRAPDGMKNIWFDPFAIEGSVADYQDVSQPREDELWLRNEFGLVFADE